VLNNLRPGAINPQTNAESIGLEVEEQALGDADVDSTAIRVSCSIEAHYVPTSTAVLDQPPVAGQGLGVMSDFVAGEGVLRLAAPKTHAEFAQVLYFALRAADGQGLTTAVVA
jgi:hypothetical protein